MLPVAILSSLLNNTTVVMLFINVVKIWSKKLSITPSKMLIPLSYAAGLGGVCTIIGSPTNLVIAGFYKEKTEDVLEELPIIDKEYISNENIQKEDINSISFPTVSEEDTIIKEPEH